MSQPGPSTGLFTPDQLKQMWEESELAKAREALNRKRTEQEEREHLHAAFMAREVRPDAMDRVMAIVRRAALDGQREVILFKFPASYCSDGGRAINNYETDWPKSLEGFGKRAYEAFETKLKPLGYRMRAQVLDYPGGSLGEIGIYLAW